MIPSGVPSVWKPLKRDGRNQACRPFHYFGPNHAYKVYANTSMKKCQQLCIKTPSCTGIEHKYLDLSLTNAGRCEVWRQSIDYTVPAASFRCLRYEPPVVDTSITLTTTIVAKDFISAGKNRACHGKQPRNSAMVNYLLYDGLPSLHNCKTRCMEMLACKGIEWKRGRCKVWVRKIEASLPKVGSKCMRYEVPSPIF